MSRIVISVKVFTRFLRIRRHCSHHLNGNNARINLRNCQLWSLTLNLTCARVASCDKNTILARNYPSFLHCQESDWDTAKYLLINIQNNSNLLLSKYINEIIKLLKMTNMENNEDKILDEEQWKLEAQAVIDDIKDHVNDVKLSDRLCSTNQVIYLNLTTLENLKFCIELSSAGFTIVGNKYDDASNKGNEYFETPYSLLNSTSPQYRDSFGNSLLEKLKELNRE